MKNWKAAPHVYNSKRLISILLYLESVLGHKASHNVTLLNSTRLNKTRVHKFGMPKVKWLPRLHIQNILF